MTYQRLSRLRAYRTGLATLRTFVGTEESHGISEAERQTICNERFTRHSQQARGVTKWQQMITK